MSTSLPIHAQTTTSEALTPTTRSEAEAALDYNSLIQTLSAAKPQPTTPLETSVTSINPLSHPGEPAYPSEPTAEKVRGALSRGTTQAVLAKMAEPETFGEETMLSKRMSREGERRTRESGTKPGMERGVSYKREDLKRAATGRLMEGDERQGYSSAGGEA